MIYTLIFVGLFALLIMLVSLGYLEHKLSKAKENLIPVFGYATLAEAEYIKALLGDVPPSESAELLNHELRVEKFKDLPELVKGIVSKSWDENDFRSYFSHEDEGSKVKGKIWYLTPEQKKILDDWEFAGLWYKDEVASAKVGDKEQEVHVYTIDEKVGKKVTDDFDPWFSKMFKEKMLGLARRDNLKARSKKV